MTIKLEKSIQIERDLISKIDFVFRRAVKKSYSAYELNKNLTDCIYSNPEYKKLQSYKKHAIYQVVQHRKDLFFREYTVWGYYINNIFYSCYTDLPQEYQDKVNNDKDSFCGYHYLMRETEKSSKGLVQIVRSVTRKKYFLKSEFENQRINIKNKI